MAKTPRQPITDEQLQGFKYFKKIRPLLDRLHDQGTRRDRAGNRVLHYDQYIVLQLIFFFNPIVTSMRGLVQASALRSVQSKLGISPTSLGSFSEAGAVFDAPLLKPIIQELGRELRPLAHDQRLDGLPGLLTVVDGTELAALAKLVGWMAQERDIKLHTFFEPLTGVPVDMDLTGAKDSEIANLRQHLLPGRVYVNDRGYLDFKLFQEIIDTGSWFVCRLRDNIAWEGIEERPLSAPAQAAGILSDEIVHLGSRGTRGMLRQPLRVLRMACKPHRKRRHTGYGGPAQGTSLLIVTNLLDLPAEVVGLIFRQRWTVELFFRFFKHILGCRHLLSHRPNGIQMQVYLAIIVCMLIALWTGRKPTLRTVEMIRFYFTGWADVDELEAHIAGLAKIEA